LILDALVMGLSSGDFVAGQRDTVPPNRSQGLLAAILLF
jgi:hypothetical protein